MPSIKEYNDKLKSLRNTTKMTRTMKMVSASKLRRAQQAQRSASAYAARLNGFIARLAASVDASLHPLIQPREEVRSVLLVVITSDRGLCGAFNNSVIRKARAWVQENEHKYDKIGVSCCGKRAYAAFRNSAVIQSYYDKAVSSPDFRQAVQIGEDIGELFVNGDYDAVHILYNQFKSALSQTPAMQQILPFQSREFLEGGEELPADYIFEPDQRELLNRLLPRTLHFKIHYALLENAAGEHGARMTAMDSATTNALNMIESYTLLRNRARQAAITTELIEIVAGAEAL